MTGMIRYRSVERLIYSASNYWSVLVGDALGAVVFFGIGSWLFRGSLLSGGLAVLVGLAAWGAVEYSAHRWVLHGPSSIAKKAHARHHADGTALISAPAFMSVAVACATWGVLSIPLSAGWAALAVFGLYAGYNYYALLHHVQHHHRAWLARIPSLARLERAHRTHHARHVVNYGVSTTWWDRLLGTYQPSDSPGGPSVRNHSTPSGPRRTSR